jgi:hypothetical protein
MRFSARQQGIYRKLVTLAWEAACKLHGWPLKDKTAKDRWYREVLVSEIGVYTSKQLNASRDFRKAAATFESLGGGGIYWQMQYFRGDANEILHSLGKLASDHKIDESYLQRIARQALQLDHLPDLHTLPPDLLLRVRVAAKIHLGRRRDRGSDEILYEPGEPAEQPF